MIHDCCGNVGAVGCARRDLDAGRWCDGADPLYGLFRAMAGQRQKDVIKARSGQADIVDFDLAVPQPARDPGHVRKPLGGRGQLASTGIEEHLGAGLGEQRLGRGQISGIRHRHYEAARYPPVP